MQGQSARQRCPEEILLTLHKEERGFEEIVKGCSHARGTVNKYLGELFDEDYVQRHGRQGAYFLTDKGRKRAEKLAVKQEIDDMTPQEIEELKTICVHVRRTRDAAIGLLRQRKITDALNEGREWIDLRELDVERDVEREVKRPKVSDFDLFDIHKRLWPPFLQEKHPDIWKLVKEGKTPKWPGDILEQFDEYRKRKLSADSAEERG